MAKVNIAYDTVDKTCSVSIDGKTLDNVMECSVYCDYASDDQPKFRFMASTMKSDEDNDMHEMHLIRANKQAKPLCEQLGHVFSSLLNNKS